MLAESVLTGRRWRSWRNLQTRVLLRPGKGLGIIEVVELIMREILKAFLCEPVISAAGPRNGRKEYSGNGWCERCMALGLIL